MDFDQAMEKGFLNLSEEESNELLDQLFDNEDVGARYDAGLALLMTFVKEEKVAHVLDLCNIVLEAYEALDMDGEEDEDEGEDEGEEHDHDHKH
jgi:hypothetical protein